MKTVIWQDREFGFKVIAEVSQFIFLPIGGKVWDNNKSYIIRTVQYVVEENKIEIIVIPN